MNALQMAKRFGPKDAEGKPDFKGLEDELKADFIRNLESVGRYEAVATGFEMNHNVVDVKAETRLTVKTVDWEEKVKYLETKVLNIINTMKSLNKRDCIPKSFWGYIFKEVIVPIRDNSNIVKSFSKEAA